MVRITRTYTNLMTPFFRGTIFLPREAPRTENPAPPPPQPQPPSPPSPQPVSPQVVSVRIGGGGGRSGGWGGGVQLPSPYVAPTPITPLPSPVSPISQPPKFSFRQQSSIRQPYLPVRQERVATRSRQSGYGSFIFNNIRAVRLNVGVYRVSALVMFPNGMKKNIRLIIRAKTVNSAINIFKRKVREGNI